MDQCELSLLLSELSWQEVCSISHHCYVCRHHKSDDCERRYTTMPVLPCLHGVSAKHRTPYPRYGLAAHSRRLDRPHDLLPQFTSIQNPVAGLYADELNTALNTLPSNAFFGEQECSEQLHTQSAHSGYHSNAVTEHSRCDDNLANAHSTGYSMAETHGAHYLADRPAALENQ